MGLFVERARPKCRTDRRSRARFGIDALDFSRDVEIALGAQKETVARTLDAPNRPHVLMQLGVRCACAKPKVARTAFSVESESDRDRLEDRALAGTVFADEERHGPLEREPLHRGHGWKDEGISPKVRDLVATENELAEVEL